MLPAYCCVPACVSTHPKDEAPLLLLGDVQCLGFSFRRKQCSPWPSSSFGKLKRYEALENMEYIVPIHLLVNCSTRSTLAHLPLGALHKKQL